MKLKKCFLLVNSIFFVNFIFFGCANSFDSCNGLFEFLQRDISDPEDEECVVDCFSNVGTIYLSWNTDERADSFILYRSENATEENQLNFVKIYEGSETSFADKTVEVGKLYRYRLDKKRGNKTFQSSKNSLAVATTIPMDLSSLGENKESAIPLTYKCHACCYYYKFDSETEFRNIVWFKVKVPPMKKAAIYVDEALDDNFQYIKQNSASAVNLKNKQFFYLENDSYTEEDIYFLVQANPNLFVQGETGGDIRSFKIELNRIESQ